MADLSKTDVCGDCSVTHDDLKHPDVAITLHSSESEFRNSPSSSVPCLLGH